MGTNMVVDEAHAIGRIVSCGSFIEIDSMGEINGTSHSGTIVGNTASIALDRAWRRLS